MKQFTKQIEVNGHTIDVSIRIDVYEDQVAYDSCLDQDWGTPEQRAEYVAKFESGQLFAAGIAVTARALDLEGSDSLWGCELVPNNMFNSKPFEDSVDAYLRDHGMVDNAVADLVEKIQSEAARQRQLSEDAFFKAVDFGKYERGAK